MKKIVFVFAAMLAIAASCTKEDTHLNNEYDGIAPVFTASVGATKAELIGTKVNWVANDHISVWNGTVAADYSTTGSGATADFTTTDDTFTSAANYVALYPYDGSASFTSGSIITVLPAAQTATAAGFDPAANIAYASSTNTTLSFKNAVAYLQFTVPTGMSDLTSVSFKGNSGEKVAGECTIDTSSSELVATGSETATISGTFTEGTTYYLAVAPQAYATGYTVTITRTATTYEMVSKATSITFERSKARNIGELWDGSVVMEGSALAATTEMTKVESDLTGTPKKVQFDEVYSFRGTLNAGKLSVREKYKSTAVVSDIEIPATGTYHVMYNKTTGRFKIYTQEMYVDLNRGNEHGASSAPWKMLRNNNPDTVDDSYPNYILTDYDGNDSGVRCDVSDFPATSDYKNAGTGGNDRNMPSYYADDEEWEKGVLYDGYCILLASTSANSEEKQLVISGLNPSSRYDFRIVSSRYNGTPSARITRFTLVGASSVSHDINQGWKVSPENTNSLLAFNFMASQKLDFDGVAPDAEGKVYIKVQGICAGTRADAHINGFRIAKVL